MSNSETPPDVVIDLTQENEEMANGKPAGDLPDDVAQQLMRTDMQSFQSLGHEEEANSQNLSHLIGMTGSRVFEEEDPIEAVAQEKILNS